MDKMMKEEKCQRFFYNLATILYNDYNVVESCNNDCSAYLVPCGTENQITYYGKPKHSFRYSDHWNWRANIKKCNNENYIQCHSVDMPRVKPRKGFGLASDCIRGFQVAVMGKDNNYHVVYGEKFDRKTKSWTWVESDPMEIASMCAVD